MGVEVNLKTLDNLAGFDVCYGKEADSLLLQSSPPEPAVSMDWEGELMIRINPKTGEITGIEIENFKRFFLKKYPFIKQMNVLMLKDFIYKLIKGNKEIPVLTANRFHEDLDKICTF